MENTTILLQLLSAGVIAAIVTGCFSLTIAIKNNKHLIELENNRQEFAINQELFIGFREAYEELLKLLPEDKLLSHIIMNSPGKKDLRKNVVVEAYQYAEENMKVLYPHFQKYCYLLSEYEQKMIMNKVELIDNISKCIITLSIEEELFNFVEEQNQNSATDSIHKKLVERILKGVEFEEMYYSLFKDNLRKLSRSH